MGQLAISSATSALQGSLKIPLKYFKGTTMARLANNDIRTAVREQYRKMAVLDDFGYCALGSSCCNKPNSHSKNTLKNLGYSDTNINQVPEEAHMCLGCGNPKAIASLKQGETVLDLGSGGGFDCLLASKEVGESGQVIGVDMTPEMISKARANAEKSGCKNVEFRLGEIEYLPVADEIVDVIISNCVVNLSPEKMRVFNESFRVLKPSGRLIISDIVATSVLPDTFKKDIMTYTRCILGASSIHEIHDMLKEAGFVQIEIKPKLESKEFIQNWMPDSKLEDYIVSASIEAIKPKRA